MIRLGREIVRLSQDKNARVDVCVRTLSGNNDRLVVDIYRFNGPRHPEDHLGWWLFHFKRHCQGDLLFDFSVIGPLSVRFEKDGEVSSAADCWFNPDYTFSPVQDLHLVLRDRQNRVQGQRTCQLINDQPAILKQFYDQLHATDGYKTAGNTFLNTLHRFKLGLLRNIFETRIKAGERVLDVGCGNSLFTEIAPEWPFKLYCCDLGEPVIRQRRSLFPQHDWLVSDVVHLPFRQGIFDALFAGEIIEHMPSVSHTLREWNRVLVPGGTLVLTTPNRRRLRNRINRSYRPLGEDHLNELSFSEIRDELEKAGFTVVDNQSFYLELLLNWWTTGLKLDYLQSSANKPNNIRIMNTLNWLGGYFPNYAFGLIFIARKRDLTRS